MSMIVGCFGGVVPFCLEDRFSFAAESGKPRILGTAIFPKLR